jgi:hypothetical protein
MEAKLGGVLLLLRGCNERGGVVEPFLVLGLL